MDYAAHAAAAAPPAADPRGAYPPGYPYAYAYPAYHYPDPAAAAPSAPAPAPASAAPSSYYYSNPAAQAITGAQYNPYTSQYHYYGAPATDGGSGLTDYYFTAGEASQAPSAAQTAPAASAAAAAGREAVKHFGFDPQRYAQVAAAKAPNGVAPTAAATVMHHAQWNAHFGHPLPTNVRRSFRKKTPKVVQPLLCEVCKIQCDTMEVLLIHKTGQKHKKNLQKLQDAITPQPAKPPNSGVAANTAPPAAAAAAADGVVPAVQPKKNKSSNASPANLEVKKRRVIEAGAAHGEMKICTACNVVVNSQKVYEFHLAGQKHKANVLKQQKQQQQQQQQQQVQLQHVA
ncbi:unnamed protein product [Triticum aestivum]|uniref:U1-type domain-containing protein n=4 Tax=Triticinae TaxID=1648030 RepID=A0A9R1JEE2_WHEAT|nr:zinc finger RNA-binding protein [Aegilops tauschii subsp. strangulata]XP_044330293.1 zinc finger RNA-binding protein-like [Triticum aestivum]KAF7013914.1 hypothetical protein CFC21_027962 [Triticum aestivum]SPT16232.1 unnamed protein product [Triticum aestivum]